MISFFYRLENNQEIKIKSNEIKKGDIIRLLVMSEHGMIYSNKTYTILTDPYTGEIKTPFYKRVSGWFVKGRESGNSEVWEIKL